MQRTLLPFLFLSAALLGGCAGGNVPPTHFYILTPVAPDRAPLDGAGAHGELEIEVASVRLPQYLERPQLIVRSSGNQLLLEEYHQWGGNLRKNIGRVLARNLSRLLDTPRVAIAPHRFPAPQGYRVELEIMQFEQDEDGKVRLSAQWRLSRGEQRKPLLSRISELASAQLTTGAGYDGTVTAMSGLIEQLSAEIGQAILDLHGGPG